MIVLCRLLGTKLDLLFFIPPPFLIQIMHGVRVIFGLDWTWRCRMRYFDFSEANT